MKEKAELRGSAGQTCKEWIGCGVRYRDSLEARKAVSKEVTKKWGSPGYERQKEKEMK